jgi:hypothetical protein
MNRQSEGSTLGVVKNPPQKMSFFESAHIAPHVMEDIMYVDDTHTPSSGNATGQRKRQTQSPSSPGTWQDLHTQQRRLLGKIDRAQTEGDLTSSHTYTRSTQVC